MVFIASRLCFWFLAYLKGVSFADGLCAWDCNWYVQIADQGYDQTPHTGMNGNAANWPFFPLYPLLMRGTAALLPLSVKWIGLLIANASMYFAILLSLQYLKQTRTQCAELFWVGLCCFGPFSFYFASGYSESLFWLLGCVALLCWHRKAYLKAGVVAALLSATRFFGIFWPIAWVIEAFCVGGLAALIQLRRSPQKLFAICVAPLGLALFIFYLHHQVGDGLAFIHVQKAWGRGVLPYWVELKYTLSFWTDFGPLFNENPNTRYSFAYFNCFACFGIVLLVFLAQQKRYFESAVALMLMVTVFKAGIIGVPRYMFGIPIFAFAVHDIVVRFFSPPFRLVLGMLLALFNFWLLTNWYESAFFLV